MCIFRDSSRSLTWYLHYFTFRYLYIFYIHPTAFILQFQVLFFFWECLVLCSTSGCFFLLVAAHVCMYIRRACHMIYIYILLYVYIYKHPKNRKVVHHYFSRICIYIYIIQFFLLKPWVYIYIHTLCFPLCFGFILAKRERLPRNLYDASGRQSEFLDLPRPMTFWVNGSHMGVSYKMRVPKNVEKGWFIISL
jgi:hypothetical protein